MNGITAFSGVGGGIGMTALTGATGGQARVGVLGRHARQHQHGGEMDDAAEQHASQQP